jgi:hypothetical protein
MAAGIEILLSGGSALDAVEAVGVANRGRQGGPQLAVDRVHRLRPVEPDPEHVVLQRGLNGLGRHSVAHNVTSP